MLQCDRDQGTGTYCIVISPQNDHLVILVGHARTARSGHAPSSVTKKPFCGFVKVRRALNKLLADPECLQRFPLVNDSDDRWF